MRKFRRIIVLVLLVGTFAGCRDTERNEAHLLIARVEAMGVAQAASIDTPSIPPAKHRRDLEALKRLQVHSGPVKQARDLCIRAHEALLLAETEQARASHTLEAASSPNEKQLTNRDRATIEQAIARSNAAIEEAKTLLPRCQSAVGALSLRHRE